MHINRFCVSLYQINETQAALKYNDEIQNTFLPSAMFRSSGKARNAGRRPLDPRISQSILWSRVRRKILLAVGFGIPAWATKSEALKIGREKNQSNARTA